MYIAQAYKGLTDIWRYLIGFLAVLFGWQVLGGIPLVMALIFKADSMADLMGNMQGANDLSGIINTLGSNLFLFVMLLTFAIGLFTLYIVVRFLHKQSWKSLTTSRKKVDWKRILFAFFLWAVISVAMILIDVQMSPEDYVFNLNWKPFLILTLITVLIMPLQTSFEEYYMRGYLMQWLGTAAKNRGLPFLVTSVLFGLLHIFNPEVDKLGYGILVYYIGTGLFLGMLVLMDEGLELALGFHAANNMTAALLLTSDWSAFQTDSVYKDISDPVLGWDVLIPVLVIYPILLLIFSKKYGWKNWKDKLFGPVLSKEEFIALENDTETLA
jgi:membrane protease YdiL (CAAX protease family)